MNNRSHNVETLNIVVEKIMENGPVNVIHYQPQRRSAIYLLGLLMLLSVIVDTQASLPKNQLLMENFVLVTDSVQDEITQFDLTGKPTFTINSSMSQFPTDLAFDSLFKIIYWTDPEAGAVFKYNMSSAQAATFFSNGTYHQNLTRRPAYNGLAIDSTTRKLYVTDEANGLIIELHLDDVRQFPRIVDSDIESKPRAIVIDSANRMLYWTDWKPKCAAIYRAPIESGEKTPIVKNRKKPIALAIDFTNQTMYWSDGDKFFEANLDGSNISLLPLHAHLTGLAVSSEFIYTTDTLTAKMQVRRKEAVDRVQEEYSLKEPRGIFIHELRELSELENRLAPPTLRALPGPVCRPSPTTKIETPTESWKTVIIFIGGSGFLLIVVASLIITICCSRSKQPRTPICEVYYDDAKSVPNRHSHFTALPAGPPSLPPLRSTSDENKYDTYEEPVVHSYCHNGNIEDVGVYCALNTDDTYQDAGHCTD